MGRRIFTLVFVAALGILLGVGIVSKQARDPLVKELIEQQTLILQGQKRLEQKLEEKGLPARGEGDVNVAQLLLRQQVLEGRIAVLESQWKDLEKALKGVGEDRREQAGPPSEDYSKIYDISVDHSFVRGNQEAPVTIVEFVDFQCPFCARFHIPVSETLKAYPGKVKYIVKNFPLSFHPMARPAAKASFAAGEQGKYWEMVDVLLENGGGLSEAKFEELAKGIGLDVNKFMKDYKENDAKYNEFINKDLQLGGQVQVRGTPTFYINGRKTMARDLEGFKTEIDEILKEQN
ncbi:MAG TPA: hypothetical protein DD723_00890 [Candidatus Omnitrophica bacterium]|nr:MAG: hypothetical protein A2Z81_02535 [Omnitrophica WOR_2 bacterium GWA2_45_18]HBR14087.1 hypothetical protein [Candidatus Omnitrophota bacterium]